MAQPNYVVIVEGLGDIDLSKEPERLDMIATQAINKTADFARASTARDLRRQYNFPGNYLDPSQGRLFVSKRAQRSNLEAMISARQRPTSLARFIVQDNGVNRQGVMIEMLKGKVTPLDKAFPVKLRSGISGEKGNLGLAVRTKPGVRPSRAYKPTPLNKERSVWLLYGISVDQAFRWAKELTAKEAAVYLESEVARLMEAQGL